MNTAAVTSEEVWTD